MPTNETVHNFNQIAKLARVIDAFASNKRVQIVGISARDVRSALGIQRVRDVHHEYLKEQLAPYFDHVMAITNDHGIFEFLVVHRMLLDQQAMAADIIRAWEVNRGHCNVNDFIKNALLRITQYGGLPAAQMKLGVSLDTVYREVVLMATNAGSAFPSDYKFEDNFWYTGTLHSYWAHLVYLNWNNRTSNIVNQHIREVRKAEEIKQQETANNQTTIIDKSGQAQLNLH